MMGKSPLTKKLIGNQNRLPAELKAKIQASPEPGSSPAKIIPLLAGKAAALIGKKLLAKGVAKAATKAAAKAGTKAATKKASGKLMEKAGKSLIDNKDNIRSKMKSRMQNKDEEDKKTPTTSLSSSNPYANQNTALQMKGKKPSPAKKEKDPKSVSGSSGELSRRLSESRKNATTAGNVGDMSSFADMFRSTSGAYDGATKRAKEEAKKTSSDTGSDTPPMKPIEKALQKRGAAIIKRGQIKGNQRAYDRAKRRGYDAETVTGLTKGRDPKSDKVEKVEETPSKMMKKAPSKMMKKAPAKMIKKSVPVKEARKTKKAMVKKAKAVGVKGVKKAKATDRASVVKKKAGKKIQKTYMKADEKIYKIKNKASKAVKTGMKKTKDTFVSDLQKKIGKTMEKAPVKMMKKKK